MTPADISCLTPAYISCLTPAHISPGVVCFLICSTIPYTCKLSSRPDCAKSVLEGEDESFNMEKEDNRESWGSRVSFLLACIGYAVGLGNIWRFPYNAYKSGGGAFLVPYFIMLVLCGIPLLFMELAVGQYTRRGPIGALDKLCPILKGAGVGTVVISFLLSTYYNVILSWALFYLISSFQDPLPWVACNNWWNSEFCFKNSENISSTFANQSQGISSTQEFFDKRVAARL